ncbi:hypothetical protein BD410DRAFT_844828 [Rickenella mellea]|uniref:F-box domain-containing protein n=1 Tax=Rickenella mellea TaxID=50990 RepID=A0A4Y7PK67_9AGAM|nr:hypothetical protein BD410DRAFT_844828 [Rickenella mellea]
MPLPPEIWREIVRLATYTPTCFDTSPHPDEWNPLSEEFIELYEANFRTKRALAFVSRQIHHITLGFLCDVLVIESLDYDPAHGVICKQLGRITPLIPFLRTTQHLLVDFISHDYIDEIAQSLEQILRQCHNLRGLYLGFPGVGALELVDAQLSLYGIAVQTQIAMAVCPGLQFLDIRGQIWENVYTNLLNRVSSNLRSHQMSAWARNMKNEFNIAMTPHHPEEIILPQLSSCHWLTNRGTNLSFSKFHMSSLTYLVIGIPSPRDILSEILQSASDSISTLRLERPCAVDYDVLSLALRAPRLQLLAYPIFRGSVAWLTNELHHDTLREVSVEYDLYHNPFGTPEEILRDHFHPISAARFPMLSTVTLMPMDGPHNVLGVYDLENGERLEDGDTFRPIKLYLRGMRTTISKEKV